MAAHPRSFLKRRKAIVEVHAKSKRLCANVQSSAVKLN